VRQARRAIKRDGKKGASSKAKKEKEARALVDMDRKGYKGLSQRSTIAKDEYGKCTRQG
jgi:hypothetical protein